MYLKERQFQIMKKIQDSTEDQESLLTMAPFLLPVQRSRKCLLLQKESLILKEATNRRTGLPNN